MDEVEDQSTVMEDNEYDEEADSDFDEAAVKEDQLSSDSEGDADGKFKQQRSSTVKHGRQRDHAGPFETELDSGDEATISEQRKRKRKKTTNSSNDVHGDSGSESEGWRAQTRAMRLHDKEEKKKDRLANNRGSTIDVDKVWEDMNRPGALPPVRMEDGHGNLINESSPKSQLPALEENKENVPTSHEEETITIKRKFKFAGEVHVEEKVVPKSSAEARLWLAQQQTKPQAEMDDSAVVQRPLRKISRFDPNYNNLAAFKSSWSRVTGGADSFRGPRLNVVEKSKMDWAAHVDTEGLKDELDKHAKAKEGYHSRMEFLNQVEQRKEEVARLARSKL